MPAPAAVMQVIVTANTAGANAALAATDKQLKRTAATSQAAGARISTMGKASAAALVGVGVVSSKVAIDFDRNMRNVNSIAQLPEKSLARLSERVRDLGGETAQSPRVLAEGLYDLVSSGFDSADSMRILEKSSLAATAGLTDTATSTKAVAAVLNAYRLPAKKAGDVSDVLFRTVDRGVISFETLAGSIGAALPASAALGVDMNSLGAAVATLTKQGQSGESAIVNINAAMTALFKPTADMQTALQDLGYDSAEALIQALGFQDGLQALIDTTDGTTASVGKLFSNVRAQRAVFGLTGKNAKGAAQDLRGLEDAAGATDRALSQQSQSVAFMWDKLKAQAEDLAIGIGNELIPAMKDVLGIISDPKLTLDEKVNAILDKTLDTIKDKGPAFVETGGKIMVAVGKGMVSSFVDANPLGKLFIGMGLVRLLGGPGALGAAGAKVMSYVFRGSTVGPALANTTVPVPSTSSKLGAGLLRAGKVLGGAALAYGVINGLTTAIGDGRNTRGLEGALDNFATGAFRAFGVNIGKTTAEEFDESFQQTIQDAGVAGLGKQAIITPEIDDKAVQMARERMAEINSTANDNMWTDGSFTDEYDRAISELMSHVKARRKTTEEMFADTWDAMTPDEQDFARRFHGALVAADRFASKFRTTLDTSLADDDPLGFKRATLDLDDNFSAMRRGVFTNMGDIRQVMHKSARDIAKTTTKGSEESRDQMSKNYRLAARNIGKAMDRGEISVRQGTRAQARLIRKAKVVSATEEQARRMATVWAKGMDKQKDFTGKGVKGIIKELKMMSPAAREAAQATWLGQLREAARNNPKLKDEFRDLRSKIVKEFGIARGDSIRESRRMDSGVSLSFKNMDSAVAKVLKSTETNLNKALSAMNVKPVSFGVTDSGGGGGKKPGRSATGATYVPGIQGGDRHLLSLNGTPISWVESGEKIAVVNREAARREMALNASVPRYAAGGVIGGDTGGLNAGIMRLLNSLYNRFGGTVSSGQRPGTLHQTGNAADYVPGDWAGAARAANSVGQSLLEGIYNGAMGGPTVSWDTGTQQPPSFWGAATWADHGDHIHLATEGAAVSGSFAAGLKKLDITGPPGPLTSYIEAVNEKLHKEASAYYRDKMPSVGVEGMGTGYVSGGNGAVAAQMGRILMRTGWNRTGAAGVIGNAYRESLWNPASVGTGGGGLFGFTTSPISLADLQNYARGHRKPWTDVGIQMQFMQDHLTSSVKNAVMQAGSPEAAAERFMTLWERPGIPALEERQAAARQAYNMKSWSRGGLLELAKGGLLNLEGVIDKTYDATDPEKGYGPSAAEQRARISKNLRAKIEKLSELGTKRNPYYTKEGDDLAGKLMGYREDADKYLEYSSNAGAMSTDDKLGLFKGQNEAYWLLQELESLRQLRNHVLEAEREAQRQRRRVAKALERAKSKMHNWLKDLNKAKRQLDREGKTPDDWNKKDLDPTTASVEKWNKQKDSKRKALAAKFERKGGRLPGDRVFLDDGKLASAESRPNLFPDIKSMGAVVGLLKDTVIPGLSTERGQLGTAVKTLAAELDTVQGKGGPRRRYATLPPYGTLGGEIFNAQNSLVTWAQSLSEASKPETFGISEFRDILDAAKSGVYAYNDLPTYHTGGVVKGSGEQPVMALAREGIFTQDQMAALGPSGDTNVNVQVDFEGMELVVRTMVNGVLHEERRRVALADRAGSAL